MTDKGYGNSGKLHKSRKTNNAYPYRDPDESEPLDDEVPCKVKKKIKSKVASNAKTNDPYGSFSSDKFYFVGGNTKLRECFEDSGVVLEKINSYARMFSPVPKLNRGMKTGAGGSSFPNGVGSALRIGMTQGWSSPPPDFDEHFLDEDEFEEKEIEQN